MNTLKSIQAYTKHGIHRSKLLASVVNDFSVPQELHPILDRYVILHWTPAFFLEQTADSYGILSRALSPNDTVTDYIIVYKNCNRYSVRKAKEIAVSFRKALPEYDIPAYVLVRTLP